MSALMTIIHVGQAGLSIFAAYHSYIAITNLQTYEATSKKLAEWSNEAANQLSQTRKTQTTGALAILLSLLTSSLLILSPSSLPRSALFAASPCLVIVVMLARSHMKNYWAPSDGKTVGVKVPLPNMGQYNEAQKATERLLEVLQWLEWSWVGACLGAGLFGY